MAAAQLCFFKFPRPLLERFGTDFFREIPRSPGVYIFTGQSGRVLYVGQSKDLRTRLAYYKNAQPEREPRRIIRLVHQTAGIQLESCETVDAARLREVALIGLHRPRFNVAQTLKPTYSFFGLRETNDHIILRLSMSPLRQEGERLVGAFKNRGLCGSAFCSIARTALAQTVEIRSVYDFPAWLNPRMKISGALPLQWRPRIESFLEGKDSRLIETSANLAIREMDSFLKRVYEEDFVVLSEFFELAGRMRQARELHEVPVLSPEALHISGEKERQVSIQFAPVGKTDAEAGLLHKTVDDR